MLAAIVYSLSLAVVAVRAQDPPAVAPTPPAAGAGGVYIPGGAGQIPGAQLITLGAGSDGFTAYEINGNVLAEDGQSVMMTSIDSAGSVVYNCQLGADAQATCNVVQQYDGVQYAYTEPITYFGGALATPSVSVDPALTSTDSALSSTTPTAVIAAVPTSSSTTSSTSSSSTSSDSSSSSSAASSSMTTTRSMAGPQASVAQATSSNIFLPAGASMSDGSTSGASALQAGVYGCAAIVGVAALSLLMT